MSNPLVSIVICCYNRAHLLPQTMASVLAQRYRPVEIVVLDDGSTDSTPELMSAYGDKVRYYRQENSGIAIARTVGCRLARGEFIAFQDDDDLMPPDRIIGLYDALCQFPSAVFAMGEWAFIDQDGKLTGERSTSALGVQNREPVLRKGGYHPGELPGAHSTSPITPETEEPFLIQDGYKAILWSQIMPTPHTSLFKKASGQQIGWFDTRFFHSCEDVDFFARLAKLGPIAYLPKVVSFYRTQHTSLCGNRPLLAYSRLLLFEKHLRTLPPHQKELRKRLQFRLCAMYNRLAIYKVIHKEWASSISIRDLITSFYLMGLRYNLRVMNFVLRKLPLRSLFSFYSVRSDYTGVNNT